MSMPEIRGMGTLSFVPGQWSVVSWGRVLTTDDGQRPLTLLLLVLGVRADHAQDALAANDLAVLTNPSHAAAYFHGLCPRRPVLKKTGPEPSNRALYLLYVVSSSLAHCLPRP